MMTDLNRDHSLNFKMWDVSFSLMMTFTAIGEKS